MRLILETWEQKQYRLRAWFAYRHLSENPNRYNNPKIKEFYLVLDKFFMQKYALETEKQTRKGILQLFKYESEQHIVINEKTILQMIEDYEGNNSLLQLNG